VRSDFVRGEESTVDGSINVPHAKKRKLDDLSSLPDEGRQDVQYDVQNFPDESDEDMNIGKLFYVVGPHFDLFRGDSHNDDNKEPVNSQDDKESGPKFHANQRVLVQDSSRTPLQPPDASNQPPLYEAVIKQSGLRHVDPVTKKVLSETKFAFSKKRGRRRPNHFSQEQQTVQDQEKEWCYLIHFLGWNSRHDRWMIEADVFANTDENRRRVESAATKVVRPVKTEAIKDKKKKKTGRPKKSKDVGGGKEASREYSAIDLLVDACELPFTLQRILVEDRDKLTQTVHPPPSVLSTRNPGEFYKKGITMLHKLPSSMNVRSILARFLEAKKKDDVDEFVRERDINRENEKRQQQQQQETAENGDVTKQEGADSCESDQNKAPVEDYVKQTLSSTNIMSKDVLKLRKKKRKQFAFSILELVDAALPKFLLYAEERHQYVDVMSVKDADNENQSKMAAKRPSEIYGGEHLLRLFVKLPSLLTSSTMPAVDDELFEFAKFVSEFIVFMQMNRDACFSERYVAVYRGGAR
jgi:hypothetical protein